MGLDNLQNSRSGRAGKGAVGSVWYQKATEAMSSCRGRYRPPPRQPKAWMVTRRFSAKRMGSAMWNR